LGDVFEGPLVGESKEGVPSDMPFWIKAKKPGIFKTEEKFFYVIQKENAPGPARFWDRIIYIPVDENIEEIYKKIDSNDKYNKEFRKALNGFLKKAIKEKNKEVGEPQGPFKG